MLKFCRDLKKDVERFKEVGMPEDRMSASFCFERDFETKLPKGFDWEDKKQMDRR